MGAAKNKKSEGSLRKKGNGIELRISINGVPKSFTGTTEAEARRKLREYRKKLQNGELSVNKSSTLLEDDIFVWMNRYKFKKITDQAYDRMENTYLIHIKGSDIGKMTTTKISESSGSDILQDFINSKSEKHSYSEVKKISELLNPFFHFAKAKKIITDNPMELVRLPLEKNFTKRTKKVEIYSDEDVKKLANYVFDEDIYKEDPRLLRYAPVYILFLCTGLRLGEMCAINNSDIDKKNAFLKVNKGLVTIRNRDRYDTENKTVTIISDTKSDCGVRIIPLNNMALRAIDVIQKRTDDFGIMSNYLIPNYNGDFLSMSTVQKRFAHICKNLGIESHGIHALRHTFGSQLVRKKENIKIVSQLMGHANIQVTLNKYIHIIREQEMKSVQMLDGLYAMDEKSNQSGKIVGMENWNAAKPCKQRVVNVL